MRLTLYGRTDCELCDAMRVVVVVEAVAREERAREVRLEVIDVDTDPRLVAAWGDEVPVLCVNGERAFAVRVEADALRRRLGREPS